MMAETACFGCFNMGKKLSAKYPFQQQEGAKYAIRLLFAINLLNFADRYVPAAVKSQIQDSLHLTDFQTALPNTGMIIVFMLSAVVFGMLADKKVMDRRIILAGAVVFWSIATGIAGFSQNFAQLVAFRSLVGVGEAAYGSIAPPLLFDFFPSSDRNVVYGVYYLAIPVGGAIGFGLGSILGGLFGWRWAFVGCGVPGIIVAFLILGLNDPVSGINDFVIECDENGDEYCPVTSSSKGHGSKLSGLPTISEVVLRPSEKGGEQAVDASVFEHANASASATASAGVGAGVSSPARGGRDKSKDSYNEKRSATGSAVSNRDSGYGGGAGGTVGGDDGEPATAWQEVWEILSNKVFFLAVLGLAANNFALGGLADWIVVFMERYDDTSMEEAGMVVGAATVVGGILGTYLGSITTEYYDGKVKNAYFLIPAIYTIPSAIILFLGLNVTYKPLGYVLIFMCQIFIWTNVAPVCTLSIDCIPVRLRARASGLCIFCQHVLGDIISPPLIGYISDQTGSLKIAIQITWVAVLLSGVCWFAGYYFLDELPVMKHNAAAAEGHDNNSQQGDERVALLPPEAHALPKNHRPITYEETLCPCCACCSGVDADDEGDGDDTFGDEKDVEQRGSGHVGASVVVTGGVSPSRQGTLSPPGSANHLTRRTSRSSMHSRDSDGGGGRRSVSFDRIPPVSVFIPPAPTTGRPSTASPEHVMM